MTGFTITDLRETLAETIRELREPNSKLPLEKARAINELAQTIINSAKVEVDALKALGSGRMQPTGFLAIEHQTVPDGAGEPEPEAGQQTGRGRLGESPRGSLR